MLDAGCGNGRFSEFMSQSGKLSSYTGIDFSAGLLAQAAENYSHLPEPVRFEQVDLRQPGFLSEFGTYDLITHHAVLHHIPQKSRRQAIINELAAHLKKDGMLMLSTWQFATNERQKRKITDWNNVGLTPNDVESGDYLLTWNRAGFGYRYCCMIDAAQTAELAENAGLTIVKQYLEDGKERDLSPIHFADTRLISSEIAFVLACKRIKELLNSTPTAGVFGRMTPKWRCFNGNS